MSGSSDGKQDEGRRSAHDMLQSVAIIQALLGTLRASDLVKPEGEPTLALISREVQLVASLCQRQLEEDVRLAPIDLRMVATEVVERSRLAYAGSISLELSPTEAEVEGDVLEWHRCLYNLVENACRAAEDDGEVHVRVTANDGAFRVTVADSGPGFGEAAAGRASLGMVTVTRVVERHAGHLELRQSALGGAELTIVLPTPR